MGLSSKNYITVYYNLVKTFNTKTNITNLMVRKNYSVALSSIDCSSTGSTFTLIEAPGSGNQVYWWGYTGSFGENSLETSALSGSFKSNNSNIFQVSLNRGHINPIRFPLPIILEENQGLEFITSSIIGT